MLPPLDASDLERIVRRNRRVKAAAFVCVIAIAAAAGAVGATVSGPQSELEGQSADLWEIVADESIGVTQRRRAAFRLIHEERERTQRLSRLVATSEPEFEVLLRAIRDARHGW